MKFGDYIGEKISPKQTSGKSSQVSWVIPNWDQGISKKILKNISLNVGTWTGKYREFLIEFPKGTSFKNTKAGIFVEWDNEKLVVISSKKNLEKLSKVLK